MLIFIILMLAEIFTLLMQRSVCENILESQNRGKIVQTGVWVGFFVLFNGGTYFWSWSAFVNLLIFSVLFVAVQSLLYEGGIRKKLMITVLFCIMGILSEFLVYQTGRVLGYGMEDAILVGEERILCALISKLVWFIEVKIVLLMLKKYRHAEVGVLDWMEVFFVPVSSICIVIFMFEPYAKGGGELKLVAACLVLFINLFTFYLYGEVQEKVLFQAERDFLVREKAGYAQQLKKNSEAWMQIQKSRHELKQTYLLVQTYLEQEAYDKIKDYYAEKIRVLSDEESIVRTGNICFDTIVNYKGTVAKEQGIEIRPEVMIPYDMELEEQEVCSLLGNLLDNAIEAAGEVWEDERIITLKAKMSGKNMYVEIGNPYEGERKKKGENFLTTKENVKEHGIGLKIVGNIVKKHNGILKIDDGDNYFKVSLLVYDIGR